MDLKISKIKVGEYRTNCYILAHNKEAIVIDPGAEAEEIIHALKENKLEPKFILLTHGHFDHVLGVDGLINAFPNLDVFINEKDVFLLDELVEQGLFVGKFLHHFKSKIIAINDGDIIKFSDKEIRIIGTPGHTPGGSCFYIENLLFSGDTLFYHTYGRVDLPYSDTKAMMKSLERLGQLPANVKVFPGHGRETTIGEEKRNTIETAL